MTFGHNKSENTNYDCNYENNGDLLKPCKWIQNTINKLYKDFTVRYDWEEARDNDVDETDRVEAEIIILLKS